MAIISSVFNEDCMSGMAKYPDKFFDLAIVDPPYTDNTDNLDNYLNKMRKHDYNVSVLNLPPKLAYFTELFRVSKNQIIWGGNYFQDLWDTPCRGFIFWYKNNPVENFADGEFAWTSFDKNAKCFDYRYYGNIEGKTSASNKIHPTQKPIALYKWLLENYAKKGDKILDTHLGSGSSRIAAYKLGFDFYGWEIDAEYFKAADERFKKAIAEPLFETINQPVQTKLL